MAYCSPEELTNFVAETYAAIIEQSEREINARLRAEGLTPPAADEMLKAAALNLSKAVIIVPSQQNASGAKLEAITKQITTYTEKAWAAVDAYIKINRTDLPLPISITVGRPGARVGEFAEMTTAEEDVR